MNQALQPIPPTMIKLLEVLVATTLPPNSKIYKTQKKSIESHPQQFLPFLPSVSKCPVPPIHSHTICSYHLVSLLPLYHILFLVPFHLPPRSHIHTYIATPSVPFYTPSSSHKALCSVHCLQHHWTTTQANMYCVITSAASIVLYTAPCPIPLSTTSLDP